MIPPLSLADQLPNIPSVIGLERLSQDQGLVTDLIKGIHQDKNGYMWFISERGLIKYDGYVFTTYKNDPKNPNSIANDILYSLYEDSDGTFWIGTNSGLDHFDPATGNVKHYYHQDFNPHSISNNTVLDILKDKDGNLWITTFGGLNLFNPHAETFRAFWHDPNDPDSFKTNRLNKIIQDASGQMWIGTLDNKGLECFDPKTYRVKHYNLVSEENFSPDIMCLSIDQTGKIWAGTWGYGLYCLEPATNICINYNNNLKDSNGLPNNIVQTLLWDKQGYLWIGTRGSGVAVLDPATEKIHPIKMVLNSDPNCTIDSCLNIYPDKTGLFWFGTVEKGICRYNPNQGDIRYYKNNPKNRNSLNEDQVYALHADRSGQLWIGMNGRGLDRMDIQSGQFFHYEPDSTNPSSFPNKTIVAIAEDQRGNIWLGGWLKEFAPFPLGFYDRKSDKFTWFADQDYLPDGFHGNIVRDILEDYTGAVWIATEGRGINIYNPETGKFHHDSPMTGNNQGLTDRETSCLLEDHNHQMWVGSQNSGLFLYNRENDTYRNFSHNLDDPQSLIDNAITSLCEDKTGNLWIATKKGLSCLDPDRTRFANYTQENGMPDLVLKAILKDNNDNLWISFDNGEICRFNPRSGEIVRFNKNDGLQPQSFAINCKTIDSQGNLYFGGLAGFNRIVPDTINSNPNIPPIVLTAFDVMGKPHAIEPFLSSGKSIELSYLQNFLTFSFAALNYVKTDKNQYSSRLYPLETNWSTPGTSRQVRYTNLTPGQYSFQVKGSNNDNVWNEKGISFQITIIPPFWQTNWFRFLAISFVVLAIFTVHKMRVRLLKSQQIILEDKVARRTEELRNKREALEKANKELEMLSRSDGLTGLANRRYFDEHLANEWRRAMRNNSSLALIMADIDYFKNYNDHYGHINGDICLQKIANILKENTRRPGDLAARYGGEEFAIILTDSGENQSFHFAEYLRHFIATLQIPHAATKGTDPFITISMGSHSMIPDMYHTPEDLMQAADKALYEAKRNGRNCVVSSSI